MPVERALLLSPAAFRVTYDHAKQCADVSAGSTESLIQSLLGVACII
jgi:hypothetical protein